LTQDLRLIKVKNIPFPKSTFVLKFEQTKLISSQTRVILSNMVQTKVIILIKIINKC
jgi:hypothetical protein